MVALFLSTRTACIQGRALHACVMDSSGGALVSVPSGRRQSASVRPLLSPRCPPAPLPPRPPPPPALPGAWPAETPAQEPEE